MSVINPGELKEQLKIMGVVNDGAIDENGFPMETTQELFKLRCKRKTISTKEYIGANREITKLTYKFICRKRNIDSEMFIEYKDKFFDIANIHEIDEMFIEITAVEKVI